MSIQIHADSDVNHTSGGIRLEERRATSGPWQRIDTADYAEIHPVPRSRHQAIALVGRAEDADLVAAAPDLLANLKFAVKLLKPWCGGTAQVERMEAAIAKAEGRHG